MEQEPKHREAENMEVAVTSDSGSGMNIIPVTLRDFFFHDAVFEHWWHHFESIHEELIKDSQALWSKVKETTEAANSLMPYDKNTDGSPSMAAMIFPRRWMFPRFLSKDDAHQLFPLDFFHLKHDSNHLFHVKEDENNLEMVMDIHDFRPDEISVRVMGSVLTVEAKHEKEGEELYTARLFRRQCKLPEGCEAKMVHSSLSSDGILVVKAHKRHVETGSIGDGSIAIY